MGVNPNSPNVNIQVRVQGANPASNNLNQVAGAVRNLNNQQRWSIVNTRDATKHGFLFNQMLFTLRRGLYATTLATGALAAGAVYLGIQFNATMEQNRVALGTFLGGVQPAKRELNFLFDLAKRTPFEFPQLVGAARKFLAFGFEVNTANRYLSVIGDTIAGLGLSAEGIDRAVLAIGQMQAKGRIMGEEILQLTELGIPALQILQQELGLSARQVQRIGEIGLKSGVGIEALMRGMDKRFHNMAAQQARTFNGQLSSLRDNTAQMFGIITEPLFNRLRLKFLPLLNKTTGEMGAAFKQGGWDRMIFVLDRNLGANRKLYYAWRLLRSILRDTGTILQKAVLPALLLGAKLVGAALIPPLVLLAGVLDFAADHTTLLKYALMFLVTRYVILRVMGLINTVRVLAYGVFLLTKQTKMYTLVRTLATRADIAGRVAHLRWLAAVVLSEIRTKGLVGWMKQLVWTARVWFRTSKIAAFGTAIWTIATNALSASLIFLRTTIFNIPIIGWILAIIALIIFLSIMIYKHWDAIVAFTSKTWRRIRDIVTGAFDWIKDNWKGLVLNILMPWTLAFRIFEPLKDAFRGAINWIIRKWNSLQFTLGGWDINLPGPHDLHVPRMTFGVPGVPYLALGGRAVIGGAAVIGEKGPELLTIPRGAVVEPLTLTERGHHGKRIIELHSHTYIGRREIGETVTQYELDLMARN